MISIFCYLIVLFFTDEYVEALKVNPLFIYFYKKKKTPSQISQEQ